MIGQLIGRTEVMLTNGKKGFKMLRHGVGCSVMVLLRKSYCRGRLNELEREEEKAIL